MAVTVTGVEPRTDPDVAAIVPDPVLVAENVTEPPVDGEKLPNAGVTVHDGDTDTGFPYASLPDAMNVCEVPTRTRTPAGEIEIVASGPAVTFSV